MYVDSFDRAAVLYAMGTAHDDERVWQEFRQVIDFSEALANIQEDLTAMQNRERRLRFEIAVLKEASTTADDENTRKHFSESRDCSAEALRFSESDVRELETELSNAECILKIAKKMLTHPRFTSLPDDVLDELIETVGYELSDLGVDAGADENDDDEEEHFGADEPGKLEDFLFDDCAVCQCLKKDHEEDRRPPIA
jgi:hypothetical protein